MLSIGASACSASDRPSTDTRTVNVLWYGEQADGSIARGTLEAIVDLERTGNGVSVDVDGLRASGAGETWTASAWTAAMFALLFYGGVPDGLSLDLRVADSIDGPSAGGLMTLAALADLLDVELDPKVTMTGTIYPNGTIGPVGGIPSKLRAAAEAGIETVIVPDSKREAVDPETGDTVDVAAFGRELGLEVVFVESLFDAREYLFLDDVDAVTGDVPPIDPRVLSVFDSDMAALAERLAALEVADPPFTDDSTGDELRTILDRVRAQYVPDTTNDTRSGSYLVAADTERLVLMWNREVAVIELATDDQLAAQTALDDEVIRLRGLAEDLLVDIAEQPVETIEELIALVDAAVWVTDALEELLVVEQTLIARDLDPVRMGQLAADLTEVDYDLARFAPAAAAAAGGTGVMPLRDDTVTELGVFVALLTEANRANEALIEVKLQTEGTAIDQGPIEIIIANDDLTDTAIERVDTPIARSIIELADQLSRYIATATFIDLDRTARTNDALLGRLALNDPDRLDQQTQLALDLSTQHLGELAGQGADPSYLAWETATGEALARADSEIVTVDEQIEGLQMLWLANITERILIALTRPISDS